ncbi:MAG: hypothetical protein RMJ44_10445 [Cytophagales bacterium]|nr:hypothetical protein [Bernardetiaceae bacterium]MDW8211494.1 hypothetical protein [Cytophagales bacterium]
MLKLPSLVKLPQHKRFHYQPRYYDPQLEDLRQRIAAIQAQMKAEQNTSLYSAEQHLRGAIRKQWRTSARKTADLSQLVFICAFSAIAYFYYLYGSIALMLLPVILVGYVWYKIRR